MMMKKVSHPMHAQHMLTLIETPAATPAKRKKQKVIPTAAAARPRRGVAN
jgi:hypothetical protein